MQDSRSETENESCLVLCHGEETKGHNIMYTATCVCVCMCLCLCVVVYVPGQLVIK